MRQLALPWSRLRIPLQPLLYRVLLRQTYFYRLNGDNLKSGPEEADSYFKIIRSQLMRFNNICILLLLSSLTSLCSHGVRNRSSEERTSVCDAFCSGDPQPSLPLPQTPIGCTVASLLRLQRVVGMHQTTHSEEDCRTGDG